MRGHLIDFCNSANFKLCAFIAIAVIFHLYLQNLNFPPSIRVIHEMLKYFSRLLQFPVTVSN